MITRDEIKSLISRIIMAFPNWKPDDMTALVDFWLEMLQDIPANDLRAAIVSLISEPGRQFAPSIGEIRGKVVSISSAAAGLPSALEAWEMVNNARPRFITMRCDVASELARQYSAGEIKAIRHYDDHLRNCEHCRDEHKPPTLHPFVEKIARAFGWPATFPGDNPEADRAHFIKQYQDELAKAKTEAAQPPAVVRYVDEKRQVQAVEMLKQLEGKARR